MQKISNNQSGFTLVETIFTIFIFTLLMMGITLMMRDIFSVSNQEFGILTNVGQARSIADNFVKEIRNGAYGANGAYPINQATNNQIIFFSTAPSGNGTVSQVRYYISGNSLYKGITNPAGSPPSYIGQPETITTLSTQMSMGVSPLFYYYDGSYNGSGNPLSSPVNINAVRFVKINLIVLQALTANSTNTFTVLAGASMRNLKNNLGN
ncbi:MAG: prepilin-type N-terminal cleavage/methylation domain-containing protein [Minisyncoccia bacterium]